MASDGISSRRQHRHHAGWIAGVLAAAVLVAVIVWTAMTSSGSPTPTGAQTSSTAAVLDIGVLVFREGLECILVLAAITASMTGAQQNFQRPVAVGSD